MVVTDRNAAAKRKLDELAAKGLAVRKPARRSGPTPTIVLRKPVNLVRIIKAAKQ